VELVVWKASVSRVELGLVEKMSVVVGRRVELFVMALLVVALVEMALFVMGLVEMALFAVALVEMALFAVALVEMALFAVALVEMALFAVALFVMALFVMALIVLVVDFLGSRRRQGEEGEGSSVQLEKSSGYREGVGSGVVSKPLTMEADY